MTRMIDGPSAGSKGSQGGGRGKGGKRRVSSGTSGAGADGGKLAQGGSTGGADDYNTRAIRHSIRVFAATGAFMKLWGIVSAKVLAKKQE